MWYIISIMATPIHREILSGTASSGSLSVNTQSTIQGILRQVIVHPATGSTIYTITITNPDDRIIYKRVSETGDIAEEVAIPVKKVHTVAITSATADEAFNIELVIEQ